MNAMVTGIHGKRATTYETVIKMVEIKF